jgi:prephenate dehydrogenase
MIERLAVIGVGLIGGSLARALRRRGLVGEIVGCGRSEANLARAVELDVIDRYETDPGTAVRGADCVVIAVTLGATGEILARIASAIEATAVVTDVGSAKRCVVDAAASALGSNYRRFVAGHPIAGTEQSGVDASFPELFEGHRVILTPVAETDHTAIESVTCMWEGVDALVTTMDVDHHDEVLAATSHLPHMLAYTLVDCLAAHGDCGEIFEYAAGGFRDFTRIASSSPEMWCDIAIANRSALLAIAARFEAAFRDLQAALADGDEQKMVDRFRRAKQARDAFQAKASQ